MIVRRLLETAAALLSCLALAGCRDGRRDSAANKPAMESVKQILHTPILPVFAGTASCSGRSCHGGLEPSGANIRQDEYTEWLTHDKHAEAYQVLFNERSKRIARNLSGKYEAHHDIRCLSCHVTPYAAGGFPAILPAILPSHVQEEMPFGVGCESCHGSAKNWLSLHTSEEWKTYKPEQKKALGMTPVQSAADLARACAGCHVGAPPQDGVPTRDVNHDLIAAGHPRLNFEMDVFLANLPPHWNTEAKEKRDGKDIHAKIWAFGQLATAEAGLELLAHRASGKHNPWPEFTEYDCFACHHDLQAKSWRQERTVGVGRTGGGGRRLGALPWGTWNFTMSRLIGDGLKSLDSLEAVMRQPSPNRTQVADHSQKVFAEVKSLQTRLETWEAGAPQHWLATFAKDKRLTDDPSWDAATQLYLAIYALDPARRPEMLEFEKRLAFPKDHDSPQGFEKMQIEELLKKLPR